MEYLQSAMSEESSGVTVGQGMEDDMVPTEIKSMADKRSIDLYLKLLESGYEKKRDIRLVVVGKKGAGKTSLIRRLFGEDITDVTSTNGIEIHKTKCKAKSDDGIWNKLDGSNEDTEAYARLRKQLEEKLQDNDKVGEPVEPNVAMRDSTHATSLDESKESQTVSQQPKIIKSPEAAEPPATPHQSNQSTEQAKRDFEKMLTTKVDLHDKEEYATLLLWDFGGDEEFYHTHQTFLSADAIYLVVTNLNEANNKEAQDLFKLWMDSIHCYSRLEDDKNNSDDNTISSTDINPPVVIVGTWKDAVAFETGKLEEACRRNLLKFTKQLSKDERRHLRDKCEYLISNKDDDHSVFKQIREDILTLARKLNTWNNKYPLKFIQLEQRLQEEKKKLPIISYQEIRDISSNTPKALSERELLLFLEFHHALRALVYFADLPGYIILDTQWLSDAFKCIVTAKKFQASTKNQEWWDKFFQTGKLNNEVLEDIFKNQTTILYEHKDHILNVMEKFDIIIRPKRSEGADNIYVPCMIKTEPEDDIYEMLNVTKDINTRSTWLCFKFRFLPPHLINHLIASLNRKYTVAEVVDHEKEERQIVLFKGTAVFELHETTKLRKLLVMARQNFIQIQVWEFGTEITRGLCKDIADFVTEELNTIMHSRFKMSNVKFEKTWECGLTKPKCVTGSKQFRKKPITEYQCDTCQIKHMFIDEWSDQHNKTPWKQKQIDPSLADTKLDFSDILDQMMRQLVISVDDRRSIEQNDDPEKKLLSMMIKRGEPNKSVCIDVLKQNSGYEDLGEKLKSDSSSSVSSPTKTDLQDVPDYKIRLQKNYLEIINRLKHDQ
ncbi:probable serine/threonine-protein kinase qkgA [Mytilus californianus]|uniref:probable serine/threonine-protein kinase qkgA n=1 Tax=Mytilus californianus TaxID=6549 RepID=UPI002246E9CE|nr:probable serine/threonine-protein kinase qkgA [Mytilus californianus]